MCFERCFVLDTGREIKLTVREFLHTKKISLVEGSIEVVVKDPTDKDFHLPIGVSHPKYWKLKSVDARRASILQIYYSGLTYKELRKFKKEYDQSRDLAGRVQKLL